MHAATNLLMYSRAQQALAFRILSPGHLPNSSAIILRSARRFSVTLIACL
jgi:hypothetical protein